MTLIKDVVYAISKEYNDSREVKNYIKQWHKSDSYGDWENFHIIETKTITQDIDLFLTLGTMSDEMILKVAIDMGVETLDFIPAIPTFRNDIKANYSNAHLVFEKAFKQLEEHPDIAIGLVNSALESIIKEILKDDRIKTQVSSGATLYTLTQEILKVFSLFPNADMPQEIKTIGSSMLSINQSIEKLRSEKTNAHGKTKDDYIVADSIFAYFIVNSVTTVGLFLNSYYLKIFPKHKIDLNDPFKDLPF